MLPPQITLFHHSQMEDDQRELQLLPSPPAGLSTKPPNSSNNNRMAACHPDPSSLDLQLSISIRAARPPSDSIIAEANEIKTIEALKRHATEQIRLAAVEKAYAEQVQEMTRREMEMAESEFARARHVWERAREEVEKAERMKDKAMRRIDSKCLEITCQACRQRFHP